MTKEKTPLRAILRHAVESAVETSQDGKASFAITGHTEEWIALEALVSAGEARESDSLIASAVNNGTPPDHPGSWSHDRARTFADPLLRHIAGALLARKASGMAPSQDAQLTGTLFEWSAILCLVEMLDVGVYHAPPPAFDAVLSSAIPSPAAIASAVRKVAEHETMPGKVKDLLEAIAKQVDSLPTVTITHHANT